MDYFIQQVANLKSPSWKIPLSYLSIDKKHLS